MSEKKNIDDGGCAFPVGPWEDLEGNVSDIEYGMRLRDYFAAKAMQGIKANTDHIDSTSGNYSRLAEEAYLIAAAMIEARKK